jgi:tetratricopeptide (TPR) repeat protein
VEFACSSAWVTNCLGYQPLELRLQVDVALPLVAIQGQASDEVTAVLSRARDLNQKLGETPQTFGAIRALHWLSFAHADYRGAFELCEQLGRIAERVNNPDFRAEALRARANSSFYLGRLTDSRELFERVLSICDREDRGAQVFADAEDPGAPAAGQLAIVLWILGYPDQALSTVQGAVATARALAAPFMMAVTQSFLASLLRLLRDIPATLEAANAAIATVTIRDLPFGTRRRRSIEAGQSRCRGIPALGLRKLSWHLLRGAQARKQAQVGSRQNSWTRACMPGRRGKVSTWWLMR